MANLCFKRIKLPYSIKSTQMKLLSSQSIDLKTTLSEKIPIERKRIQEIKKSHGTKKIGDVTVNMLYGGMRGLSGLIWETSVLDPNEGIRFRGYSISECLQLLPKSTNGSQPLPEGLFWLLMTGEIPTTSQVKSISREWAQRARLPSYLNNILAEIPKSVHPMAQLSIAITALSKESKFSQSYASGMSKTDYWEDVYEDSMNLIAKLPVIAATVYGNVYNKSDVENFDISRDWSDNFAKMLGYRDSNFADLMRLFLTIHSDHEGGNVSAHTVHLVGSALSDPYLSFASGVNGLAGPLHGLASQTVLLWLQNLQFELGSNPSPNQLKDYVWKTIKSGKVIPGYGHAVLRKTDPRYSCQREFAIKFLPEDELFNLVSNLYNIVPDILMEFGKVKNPWPNVDAHSGVLLHHFGLKEVNYYTVLFAVSRSLGVLSQLIWSRALGFPIERPKSLSTNDVVKLVMDNE